MKIVGPYRIFLLVWVLVFHPPTQAAEYRYSGTNSLSLGLTGRCFSASEEEQCFVGQKLSFEHGFLRKSKTETPEYEPLNAPLGGLDGLNFHFVDGELALAILFFYLLLFVFFVFVVPGIVWMIGAIYANYIEGTFYGGTLLLSGGKGSIINSVGVKFASYPSQSLDLNFYLGAAYSFTSFTDEWSEGGSMQLGIGLVPRKRGFMAAIEFERHILNKKVKDIHAQEIIDDSRDFGQSSLVLGWRF